MKEGESMIFFYILQYTYSADCIITYVKLCIINRSPFKVLCIFYISLYSGEKKKPNKIQSSNI